jgi:predicted GH43/DUF377 family glycosyl hydrolase
MKADSRGELFQRYEGNPILTRADWPHTVNAVFNPGVARFEGGTLLLARVEDRTGISHLAVARSTDGLTNWTVDRSQTMLPDLGSQAERYGIEDPRITPIGDEHLITYVGYSSGGPHVCLASTRDFRTFERRGVIMPPEDKDAALFPRRFRGRWALIHRPVSTGPRDDAHIWLSWSPDLRHWGDHAILIPARQGGWWDAHRVGLCAPPLETPEGWLLLYHGVHTTAAGSIYRLGLALLDRDQPEHVLARSNEWLFGPDAPYERIGDVDQVVFSCGWQLLEDGDALRMYYGAADTSICVATASVTSLLAWLAGHSNSVARRPQPRERLSTSNAIGLAAGVPRRRSPLPAHAGLRTGQKMLGAGLATRIPLSDSRLPGWQTAGGGM